VFTVIYLTDLELDVVSIINNMPGEKSFGGQRVSITKTFDDEVQSEENGYQ